MSKQTLEHFHKPDETGGCIPALLVLAISTLLWTGVIGGIVLLLVQWLS
jgi:hypothetical protein